jgi:hypothetical protein
LILKVPHLQSVSALFFLLLNIIILHVFFFDDKTTHLAYGHFFGSIKQIGNYQIVFQPLPFIPFANEDSTLNFSILDKNNANANNVYAALTIQDKATGKLVEQTPFRFYEFSDISFPYKFRSNSNYMVTFDATINGDPIYQGNPLIASFDLFVGNPPLGIPFDRAVLLYGLPTAIIVPIGLAIYHRYRKKSTK